MNRNVLKVFILFVLMIFSINITNTYASSLGDVISGGKNFIQSGSGSDLIDTDKLSETSGSIYNILLMISFVVVAIVGISLGIKFMMSGVEEKADVKKSLVIFFIGCVVVYGAFGIWKVLVTFLNTL